MSETIPTTSHMPATVTAAAADDGAAIADIVRPTLLAWAMEEMAALRLQGLSRESATQRFLALNDTSRSIHVYLVADGSVSLLEKPAGVQPSPTDTRRSLAYLDFFREVCRLLPDGPPFHLALETADKVTQRVDVPVFAFQKRRGEPSILLPDIDFLNHDFYTAPRYQDTRAYRSKVAKAIFVGSTSGGRVTPEAARMCTLPRLRAARFFDGNPQVEFLLPQIVQTTSEEAAEILRQEAFCQAPYMPFQEQLSRRFVISMDGNGATCSRVVIALKSNSVLLKYHSEDLLYYFRHLQPWLHYVPVQTDSDIDQILVMERKSPAFFENIAESGRQFAETYLSRDAVLAYTAELFNIYAACFSDGTRASLPVARLQPAPQPALPPKVVFMAHMSGRGDVSADAQGWIGDAREGRIVEGFMFSFGSARLDNHIFYRGLAADGTTQAVTPAGSYCGTRGHSAPLHGFVIDADANSDDVPRFEYEGIFRDGFASGKLVRGALCRSPDGAPLVAMRIGLAKG